MDYKTIHKAISTHIVLSDKAVRFFKAQFSNIQLFDFFHYDGK